MKSFSNISVIFVCWSFDMATSGDIVQSTTYYPYGEPTIEPQGQRFLFGGKEREHAAGRNSYDFGARTLAANAWTTPDPLAEKFYPLSPYSYCGGDPINRVDRDGKEWTVTEDYTADGRNVSLKVTGVVINASSTAINLSDLASKIKEQLQDVFTFSTDKTNVSMQADIRVVNSANEIYSKDHVFVVVDQVNQKRNTVLAKVNALGGLGIVLGNKIVSQTLSGANTRTIAHEMGHSANLTHTNKEIYKDSNLMTQLKALSDGIDPNNAISLTSSQIEHMVDSYKTGELNRNSPLIKNYKINFQWDWPIIKYTPNFKLKF